MKQTNETLPIIIHNQKQIMMQKMKLPTIQIFKI